MPRGVKRSDDEIRKMLQTITPVLQRGTALTNACKYCNIPERTLFDYINKHEWVRREIDTAMAFLDVSAENTIANAIKKGDTLNARWRLERSQKDKYSIRHELTGENGKAIEFTLWDALEEKDDEEEKPKKKLKPKK